MSDVKALQCPACFNHYSMKFQQCPECEVGLIQAADIQQGINGHGSQGVIVSGSNSGPIINKPTVLIHPPQGQEIARYDATQVDHYDSAWQVARPGLLWGASAGGAGLLQWASGWASILSFLGISAQNAKLWEHLIIFGILVAAIRTAAILSYVLPLFEQRWVRRAGKLYWPQEDGSILLYRISAKCPVSGCPGQLYLGRPPANEEGVGFAGLCSKYGMRHAFEFNDETLEGSRIKLTPKRKDQ